MLNGIQNLYKDLTNREEAIKIKAREIFKESMFEISYNEKKSIYEVNIKYKLGTIGFRVICELRDRTLLLLNNFKQEYIEFKVNEEDNKTNYEQVLKDFIKVVEISENILYKFNEIHNTGYPLQPSNSLLLKNGNIALFELFYKDISQILKDWEKDLDDAYYKYYFLTYLNGNQFWDVEKIFTLQTTQTNLKMMNGYLLLKYISPDIDNQIEVLKQIKLDTSLTPKERINALGSTLNQIINPSKNGNRPIKNNMIQTNLEASKVIYSSAPHKELYNYLLSLHFTIESALPASNQILYCMESTTLQELTSFLFRFLFCTERRLYTLLKVENLALELKYYLVESINKFLKHDESHKTKALLSIICSDDSFKLTDFNEHSKIYNVKKLDILDDSTLSHTLDLLDINTCIVVSFFYLFI